MECQEQARRDSRIAHRDHEPNPSRSRPRPRPRPRYRNQEDESRTRTRTTRRTKGRFMECLAPPREFWLLFGEGFAMLGIRQNPNALCTSEFLSERRTSNMERSTLNSFTATLGFV